MDEPFQIPVIYRGIEYQFDAQFYTTSYQYRIEVLVKQVSFSFERDDEGNFRAIALKPNDNTFQEIDSELLRVIADTLQKILS